MWFVHKGVILTKDNLMKRNWVGNPRCCFVIRTKQLNTSFSSVHLQNCYGDLFI
uniref:Uncharacterized protein n=1 Tax=Aegilops tauschii subsp. strangulata TaxID=200361 RepID=A0A453ELC4_AEGTS